MYVGLVEDRIPVAEEVYGDVVGMKGLGKRVPVGLRTESIEESPDGITRLPAQELNEPCGVYGARMAVCGEEARRTRENRDKSVHTTWASAPTHTKPAATHNRPWKGCCHKQNNTKYEYFLQWRS